MVPIPFPPNIDPLVWAVGAHGVTDLWTHTPYLGAYIAAIPRWPATSTALTLCSVKHFAADVGLLPSVALHTCIVLLAAARGAQAASVLAVGYLALVHVPAHFYRVHRHIHGHALCFCLTATAAAAACPAFRHVPDAAQRVACVHVLLHELPAPQPRRRAVY